MIMADLVQLIQCYISYHGQLNPLNLLHIAQTTAHHNTVFQR